MGTRLGWLGALGATGLALGRLSRLLSVGPDGEGWLTVLVTALVIGGVVTAGALAAGARPWMLTPLGVAGAGMAVGRVAAGSTMTWGVIPTRATVSALNDQIGVALELIRFGSAPVIAASGLVALLAGVWWLLGSAIAFGAIKKKPLAMILPSLGLYLLLATLDRQPPQWWWPVLLAVCGVAGLLASAERRPSGRARSLRTGRLIPSAGRLLPVVTVIAVASIAGGAARGFAATVPESGLVSWRNATGFGGGLFGGVSYNLIASMTQQDLVGQSPEVLFVARVSESSPPNSDLYWKLISLDSYDGDYWLPANLTVNRPFAESDWEEADFQFVGPSVRVESIVRVVSLRQNYLPVLYSPRSLVTDDPLLADSHRAREDGSVKFDARTTEGLTYRVVSDLPQPDVGALASTGGVLSPIFANAQAAGQFALAPAGGENRAIPGRVRELYTALPEEFPTEVREVAAAVAAQASTDFERGFLLENFFRSAGGFVYDVDVSTGHSTLDLTAWLLDPASRNFRRGYCEQFASAMAVMARALRIPARVVLGFAPGEVVTQDDGSELIVVRALNAHAWVELYMAGQGWVRFDPTPRGDGINPATVSRLGFDPTLYLPEPTDPAQDSTSTATRGTEFDTEFLEIGADPTLGLTGSLRGSTPAWLRILLIAAAVAAVIPTFKLARRYSRIRKLESGDVAAGWAEMKDRLADLGHRLDSSLTPHEVAARVDPALVPFATRLGAFIYGGRLIPDAVPVYRQAERALRLRHQGWRWWWSWWSPQSLRGDAAI